MNQCMVLPLILQPVVENAILHGLEERELGGMVTIDIGHCDTGIRIAVSDNGCGMEPEALQCLRQDIEQKNPQKKESIGLYNINQRVRLCYGEAYGMAITSQPGTGTTVSLILPEEIQHYV